MRTRERPRAHQSSLFPKSKYNQYPQTRPWLRCHRSSSGETRSNDRAKARLGIVLSFHLRPALPIQMFSERRAAVDRTHQNLSSRFLTLRPSKLPKGTLVATNFELSKQARTDAIASVKRYSREN